MTEILAAFINAGIAAAFVTCTVGIALWLAPRRVLNAATRYVIWWLTLAIVVTLPVFYLPHRPAPAAPSETIATPQNSVFSEATVAPPVAVSLTSIDAPA